MAKLSSLLRILELSAGLGASPSREWMVLTCQGVDVFPFRVNRSPSGGKQKGKGCEGLNQRKGRALSGFQNESLLLLQCICGGRNE